MLLHDFHLPGQFEQRLDDFRLDGWCVELWHLWVEAGNRGAQLVAGGSHWADDFGTTHDGIGTGAGGEVTNCDPKTAGPSHIRLGCCESRQDKAPRSRAGSRGLVTS